jgi:DNA polymerase III subunit delta'
MWKTIGQEKAIALLKHELSADNAAHAYLLIGPAHIGKLTLAMDLSKALNCAESDPPCGNCMSCQRIAGGKHADVMLTDLDNPARTAEPGTRTKISINEIREIERSASLFPYEGIYKVFIINGAENMSHEAANALLKILEEPPEKVVFILTAADESLLLPTVISRCQCIELSPLPAPEIERMLLEQQGVAGDKARLISRLSGGCPGWALSASIDEGYLRERDDRLSRIVPLLSATWEDRFSYAAQFENNRKKAEDTLYTWLVWWRDIMLVWCGCQELVTNIDRIAILEEWANTMALHEISNFIDHIELSLEALSRNANIRLLFETIMLEMPRAKSTNHEAQYRHREMQNA